MEVDENSLEWAQKFKKNTLRFDVGSIVYLSSDIKRKNPMVVSGFWIVNDDADYICQWMTSQRELKQDGFIDKILQDGNV